MIKSILFSLILITSAEVFAAKAAKGAAPAPITVTAIETEAAMAAMNADTANAVAAATARMPTATAPEATADAAAMATANNTEATPVVAAAEAAAPAAANAKLAEDQIPLNIEAAKKANESGSATKAMMSAFIVISLIGVSYYMVRKYKVSNKINKSNAQIKVISQHYLGPKRSLAIIHVAGESMLIGVTDQNISMIKSLSLIDDEIPATMPKSFSETMTEKAMAMAPMISAASTAQSAQSMQAQHMQANQPMVDELDEEFSFAGVTDTVSKKIKSMRSFS